MVKYEIHGMYMYFVSKHERLRFKDEGKKDVFLHFVRLILFISLKGFYSPLLKYI